MVPEKEDAEEQLDLDDLTWLKLLGWLLTHEREDLFLPLFASFPPFLFPFLSWERSEKAAVYRPEWVLSRTWS